ncbi:hypothetical protein SUGI_1020840 [Cryptomeria japonica]|nr:hypothetical protein SUGI_1020840 [Cryptomeria japonica]
MEGSWPHSNGTISLSSPPMVAFGTIPWFIGRSRNWETFNVVQELYKLIWVSGSSCHEQLQGSIIASWLGEKALWQCSRPRYHTSWHTFLAPTMELSHKFLFFS